MNKRMMGVSLLELMIVVVVVGLLAAVAYPNYRQHVVKSRWTDAKAALTETAAGLERCFTRYNEYDNAACPDVSLPYDTVEGTYSISATTLTDTTFTLQATPAGAQAGDTRCGSFTLTSANVRGVTGSLPVNDCW